MPEVLTALIWATALTAVSLVAIFYLGRPLRRTLEALGQKHTRLEAESAARLEGQLLGLEERRHALDVRRGTLPEEITATKAALLRDAAEADIDAKAAEGAIEAATDRRRVALQALGEAEAALAPDRARAALEAEFEGGVDMDAIARAYASYCDSVTGSPWTFGSWLEGVDLGALSGRRNLTGSR